MESCVRHEVEDVHERKHQVRQDRAKMLDSETVFKQ